MLTTGPVKRAWATTALTCTPMHHARCRTYIFLFCSTHSCTLLTCLARPVFFFIQRCVPISATQTSMEYEVYKQNDATEEEFAEISDFFKNVMREDKDLCNEAAKNLTTGIFLNGELHPRVEKVRTSSPIAVCPRIIH